MLTISPPGELSVRALNKTKGIHEAKNPYAAPITAIRDLFTLSSASENRNCIHAELDITGSGLTYQHGDHVGIWPINATSHVEILLHALGLYDKRAAVISIDSLDPALAKVPFPVPTTYETVLKHYIDISAVAGRQSLNALARYAPSPEASERISKLGSDKEAYLEYVSKPCLTLGEVLLLAAGDKTVNPSAGEIPSAENVTKWAIPFDVVVSTIARLQARYYSISSSPKLHPQSIHVTCVVLKYQNEPAATALEASGEPSKAKWVFGVGSNYLLNLKVATDNETAPLQVIEGSNTDPLNPVYDIAGPRGSYAGVTESAEGTSPKLYKVPIHVRRSTFRLPTNPKSPVLMIGPGTVRPVPVSRA